MPEGNRRTPVDVIINFEEFSENIIDGFKIFQFFVKGSEYLELPLDANVRLPSEKSYPYKKMIDTLETNQGDFLLQNGGIDIIAARVDVNDRQKKVKFNFPPNTGIVNGGHTQLALLNTKRSTDISNAKIKLQVIEHTFTREKLAEIAASKNTASNVQPYSKAEKLGYFGRIKSEMTPDFEKHIIWYENRDVPHGIGLSAVDLISILNVFNVLEHQSRYSAVTDQPNQSATSKASVFRYWESKQHAYLHTYPLTNDILSLMEHIQATFHKGIPKGFTTLTVIGDKNDPPKKTIFLGKDITWNLPKQFILPLLASFRADVYFDEAAGKIGWFEKPDTLFDKAKNRLFSKLLTTYKSTYHGEINRASKDANLWQILYMDLDPLINKSSKWKEYAIPR